MRNRLAVIIFCTAVAVAVVWTSPFMLWVLALIANYFGI